MSKKYFLYIILSIAILACKEKEENKELTFEQQLTNLPDSIQADDVVIYNAFKHQVLANNGADYNDKLIEEKVYNVHKTLWNDCYGMIFGEENAGNFNSAEGMAAWNKKLYAENKDYFKKQAELYLTLNIDSLLTHNLKKFNRFVPHKPKARISIAFVPMQGIGFGGCTADQFVYELNNNEFNLVYSMEKGIPHELNHIVYEPYRLNDPLGNTALGQTIDEGFACYFTRVFFDNKITAWEAVEDMSKEDWDWYISHEKEIFNAIEKYFYSEEENPLTSYDQDLFPDAPKSLNYWLGYRIVEKYVQKHGKDSWKDIYSTPIKDVYEKSGYKAYIQAL